MKFFSDLRLANSQFSEQAAALILVGVAAVIIGGVAHMGMHRRDNLKDEQDVAAAVAAIAPANDFEPVVAASTPAPLMTAVPAEVTPAPVEQLTPLAQTSNVVKQAIAAAEAAVVKPEHLVRAAELGRGDTLASLLADADIDNNEAHAVLQAIRGVYNLKKLPRGLEVSMQFTRTGEDESFEGLSFQAEPTAEIKVARLANGGFKAEKIVTPLERQRFAVAGAIRTSLYDAGAAQGVPRSVMAAMIRAFSHEVDFQRDLQPGDKFRVLYDQPRTKNGQPTGEATIIFAELKIDGETKSVYRVIYGDGTAEYFNGRGESVKRGLMRTPVDGARMSSSFGMRRHPILGYSKFHKGVDFAAPTGTPVYAAGDGVVQEIGYKSGYGRFILVRHTSGLSTAYGHMSRFARGLARGARVQQGDVIAYVGMTGRTTGPHLHFEVRVDNQAVNPLSVNMRSHNVLAGKQMDQFVKGKGMIEQEFKRVSVTALDRPGKTVKMASK